MTRLLALSLSLLVASCASRTSPASLPVMASSYPVDRSQDDWLPVAYGGRVGVWISEDALGDLLAGFERDKGALKVQIAKANVGERIATETAEAVTKNARGLSFRATWGPWLGFAGGVTAAGIAALVIFAVMRTLAPAGGFANGQ